MVMRSSDLRASLIAAIAAVDQAQLRVSPGSDPVLQKFTRARETLTSALHAIDSHETVNKAAFDGLSKWVADWIPEIDDPLLDSLDEVERLVGLD